MKTLLTATTFVLSMAAANAAEVPRASDVVVEGQICGNGQIAFIAKYVKLGTDQNNSNFLQGFETISQSARNRGCLRDFVSTFVTPIQDVSCRFVRGFDRVLSVWGN